MTLLLGEHRKVTKENSKTDSIENNCNCFAKQREIEDRRALFGFGHHQSKFGACLLWTVANDLLICFSIFRFPCF